MEDITHTHTPTKHPLSKVFAFFLIPTTTPLAFLRKATTSSSSSFNVCRMFGFWKLLETLMLKHSFLNTLISICLTIVSHQISAPCGGSQPILHSVLGSVGVGSLLGKVFEMIDKSTLFRWKVEIPLIVILDHL